MRVLVLNAGSSTLKASVLDTPERGPLFTQTVETRADAPGATWQSGVESVLAAARETGVDAATIDAVGHRIVHGGTQFRQPVLVDSAVADAIGALADLAPLHNPPAVATLRAGLRALPNVPHVAAFDTAFHATIPEDGYRYPVPEPWYSVWGVRRFGFHGLSVEWSMRRTGELLDRPTEALRLVVAHLGSGCSVTALDAGRSVDTSMGMTPLEGLMMGTRAGSIDPGIIFGLLRRGVAADAIEADLEHNSGLVGVAGTQDVRELLRREAGGDEAAMLALELFVRRAAGAIAAAATTLPMLDALVFTAGIGENSAMIRRRICRRLAALGVPEPADGGALHDEILARSVAGPAVVRVHAREDLVIADAVAVAAHVPDQNEAVGTAGPDTAACPRVRCPAMATLDRRSFGEPCAGDPSFGDAAGVMRTLGTDPDAGLTAEDAAARLVRVGANELAAAGTWPAWRRFAAQFADPLIYLLIASILASLAAWGLEGASGVPVEAIVVVPVVLANGVLGFVQDRAGPVVTT